MRKQTVSHLTAKDNKLQTPLCAAPSALELQFLLENK